MGQVIGLPQRQPVTHAHERAASALQLACATMT